MRALLLSVLVTSLFPAQSFAQEEKFDCLAGLCLGSPASSSISGSTVTVADHKWWRETEVCSGVVVSVFLTTGWSHDRFDWRDLPDSAETKLEYPFQEAVLLHVQLRGSLRKLGWSVSYELPSKREDGVVWEWELLRHPGIKGWRSMGWTSSSDLGGTALWLASTHPQKDDLCEAKMTQGL